MSLHETIAVRKANMRKVKIIIYFLENKYGVSAKEFVLSRYVGAGLKAI
jgi:hypothetical protein